MAMKIKKTMGPIIINGQEILKEIKTELEFDELDEFIAYQESEMEATELLLAFLDEHFEDLLDISVEDHPSVVAQEEQIEEGFTLTPPPFTLEISEDQEYDNDDYEDEEDYYDLDSEDDEEDDECEESCEVTSPMESGISFSDFIAMFAKMPGIEVAVENELTLTPAPSFTLDLARPVIEEVVVEPEIAGQNGFFDDYYKSR